MFQVLCERPNCLKFCFITPRGFSYIPILLHFPNLKGTIEMSKLYLRNWVVPSGFSATMPTHSTPKTVATLLWLSDR